MNVPPHAWPLAVALGLALVGFALPWPWPLATLALAFVLIAWGLVWQHRNHRQGKP